MKKSLIKTGVKKSLELLECSSEDVRRKIAHWQGKDICRNVNNTNYRNNALLCYITEPFFSLRKRNGHQNQWQAVAIARVLGEFGYNVDVIDYDCKTARLSHHYDLVIDMAPGWYGSKLYESFMNQDCKLIFYVTGSYPKWAAKQSELRRKAVFERRGVEFKNHREFRPIPEYISDFDAAFMFGNEYNWKTYTDVFKMPPVYYIANSGYKFPYAFDRSQRKSNKFLFFASGDQIHKGLDLLLEVFSQKDFPCELYICSSFESEKLFCETYHRELYETVNIHAVGFVDIMGDKFKKIVESCQYIIVPSCSEGKMGSALTAMSAGLIPILTLPCGYDADEAILLPDAELKTIEKYVLEYAAKDEAWRNAESDRVLKLVAERYTNESFVRSIIRGLAAVTQNDVDISGKRIQEIAEE